MLGTLAVGRFAVPASAPAGNEDPHAGPDLEGTDRLARLPAREILSRTPTEARQLTREDPPELIKGSTVPVKGMVFVITAICRIA